MQKRFYVMDEENLASYSAKKDAPEHFTVEAAAIKRAGQLAESEPGKTFYVCTATRFAACKVARASVQYIK